MPDGQEVVEVVEDTPEVEVPKDGLTDTDLLIDLNDNITQLSNYLMERNEQLDKKAAELEKEEQEIEKAQKEVAAKEQAALEKQVKQEKELEIGFRESVMAELNEISELPQYESNEVILTKLEEINDNLGLQKQTDHLINGYGVIVLPAIILIWLLWRTFKNATDGLL